MDIDDEQEGLPQEPEVLTDATEEAEVDGEILPNLIMDAPPKAVYDWFIPGFGNRTWEKKVTSEVFELSGCLWRARPSPALPPPAAHLPRRRLFIYPKGQHGHLSAFLEAVPSGSGKCRRCAFSFTLLTHDLSAGTVPKEGARRVSPSRALVAPLSPCVAGRS